MSSIRSRVREQTAGGFTEMRRSLGAKIFPPLLAGLWFFSVVQLPSDLLGQGNNVALYVHVVGVIIIGITGSAVAAWEVTRARRTGVAELERSSSVPRSALTLRVVAPVLAWAWLTYTAVQVAALVRSFSVRVNWPNPTVIILTLAFIAALVAWGALCGSVLPPALAPFVAAGLAYLGAIVQSVYSYDASIARLFPVLQERWDPAMKPDVPRLLLVTAWLIVLATILFVAAARDQHFLNRPSRWVPLSLVVVATALPLLAQPVKAESFYGQSRDDRDPHQCRPTTGGGQICLYEADASALPTFAAGYAMAFEAAGTLPTFPTTVAAGGLHGPAPVMAYENFERPDEFRVAAAILDYTASPTYSDPQTCPSPPTSPLIGGDDWSHFFQALLRDRAGMPSGRQSAGSEVLLKRLREVERTEQDRWLAQAIADYSQCKAPPPPPT